MNQGSNLLFSTQNLSRRRDIRLFASRARRLIYIGTDSLFHSRTACSFLDHACPSGLEYFWFGSCSEIQCHPKYVATPSQRFTDESTCESHVCTRHMILIRTECVLALHFRDYAVCVRVCAHTVHRLSHCCSTASRDPSQWTLLCTAIVYYPRKILKNE